MLTCDYIVMDNVDIAYMRVYASADSGVCYDGARYVGMVSDSVFNQNLHSLRGLCSGRHAEALASAPELGVRRTGARPTHREEASGRG
jgi:hypothetical protein